MADASWHKANKDILLMWKLQLFTINLKWIFESLSVDDTFKI